MFSMARARNIYQDVSAFMEQFKGPRNEKKKKLEARREYMREHMLEIGPVRCLSCSATGLIWIPGATTITYAAGLRLFEMPATGHAMITTWTCSNCGTKGRYARAFDTPEYGWILLPRMTYGW